MSFPGASRYRSTGSSGQGPTSSYMDPYTGASRYSPVATPPSAAAPPSGYMDPFTGASRYSGAPSSAPVSTTNVLPSVRLFSLSPCFALTHLVQVKSITFKQVKDVNAIQGKMYELDDGLRHEIVSFSPGVCLQNFKVS